MIRKAKVLELPKTQLRDMASPLLVEAPNTREALVRKTAGICFLAHYATGSGIGNLERLQKNNELAPLWAQLGIQDKGPNDAAGEFFSRAVGRVANFVTGAMAGVHEAHGQCWYLGLHALAFQKIPGLKATRTRSSIYLSERESNMRVSYQIGSQKYLSVLVTDSRIELKDRFGAVITYRMQKLQSEKIDWGSVGEKLVVELQEAKDGRLSLGKYELESLLQGKSVKTVEGFIFRKKGGNLEVFGYSPDTYKSLNEDLLSVFIEALSSASTKKI